LVVRSLWKHTAHLIDEIHDELPYSALNSKIPKIDIGCFGKSLFKYTSKPENNIYFFFKLWKTPPRENPAYGPETRYPFAPSGLHKNKLVDAGYNNI